jgi:gliding motility-associated-like protein
MGLKNIPWIHCCAKIYNQKTKLFMKRTLLYLSIFLLVFFIDQSQAQTTYMEGHFKAYTNDDLSIVSQNTRRHVTHLLDGGFVVAWVKGSHNLQVQRFDATGELVGDEITVNDPLAKWPWSPYMETLENGHIVIGWDGNDIEEEFNGYLPHAQILEIPEEGTPLKIGDNFRINETKDGNQIEISMAELANGDIVYTWLSNGDDNIKSRIFDKVGNARTAEFVVNESNHKNTGSNQDDFANVVGLPGGGFVITWYSGQPGFGTEVFAKVYKSFEDNYSPLTADFLVNHTTGEVGNQENPLAYTFKDGFFIIYENYSGAKGTGIRKFDFAGNPISDATRVNPNDPRVSLHPHASELSDGQFIVVGQSGGGGILDIYGQLLDEDLNPIGDPFKINTSTNENNFSASVAGLVNGKGGFATVWSNSTTTTVDLKVFSEDIEAVEDELSFFDDLSHVSIHDPDPDATIYVTLSVNAGILSTVAGDGLEDDVSVSQSGSSSMTLSGLQVDITNFIQSGKIGYLGNENLFGNNADELVINAYDIVAPTTPVEIGAFNIDIEGTPDPAVIGGDVLGSVTEDRNLNADEHLEDIGLLTISDPDGPSEEIFTAGIYNGAFGKLELTANGVWTYTIDNSLKIVQNLNFGQSFVDNVIIQSIDGTTQVIMVTINGENELTLEAEATDVTVECSSSNSDELNDWLASIGNTGAATNACGDISWSNNYNGKFDDGETHGSALVTFTATNACGNTVSTSATFTIEDTTVPTITCIPDITVSTDEDSCEAILVLETPETADNCKVVTITHNSPELFPIGETAVLWVVTDGAGNTASCEQIITIEDNELPVISCPDPLIVSSDPGSCEATVILEAPEFSDNCDGAVITNNAPEAFPLGDTIVVWTVMDTSENEVSCEQLITVEDTEVPVVNSTTGFTLQLDENGEAILTVGDIDNGSTDNCGIATLSLDLTNFDCSNLGDNTVTLTVTDESDNQAMVTTNITVEDNIAPTITCLSDVSVNADVGSCEAKLVFDNPETNDNCGVASVSNDAPDTFAIGETIVTWTVTDTSGNTATCEQVIRVDDTEPPVANCVAAFTVQLDATGNASITADMIDDGSTDNCEIASIEIDQTSFDCSNIGENTVTLTVIDESGNKSTCEATLTVEDVEAPVVLTQDISVELDSKGNATITTEDINEGSYDNCGIASMSLNITSFSCPTLGDNEVILTVIDDSGNTASQTATVTFTAPDQDGDDIADVCDDDIDGDGVDNDRDNCVTTANPSQADLDRNGIGDVCDNGGLVIPKGFSPNGDGINDTFVIGGLYSYPRNSIEIYNRWGNLVYETQNYQNDWNGVAFNKSKTLPAAPYLCLINLGDSSEIIKCWVYINY